MAADLIPAPGDAPLPHRLRLPPEAGAASPLEEVRFGLGGSTAQGRLSLESGSWELTCDDLRQLSGLLRVRGLELIEVVGSRATTLVAASALGLEARWAPDAEAAGSPVDQATAGPGRGAAAAAAGAEGEALLIHRGTLRSGDHLQTEGSVLVLGDVNPGARISAGGHVLVWGRLRGSAHAGRNGDATARIVALQLRPLQLRIAAAVARGPEDTPPEGLAEEARLEQGEIRIEPARSSWPLS
jgi:septum site-determining protein MinC